MNPIKPIEHILPGIAVGSNAEGRDINGHKARGVVEEIQFWGHATLPGGDWVLKLRTKAAKPSFVHANLVSAYNWREV